MPAAHSMCTLRFEEDQTFSSLQGTTLETMSVVDGTWYVYLKGDYAGRVSGAVYDMRNSSDPVKLVTTVSAIHSLHQLMMHCCTILKEAAYMYEHSCCLTAYAIQTGSPPRSMQNLTGTVDWHLFVSV